MKTAGIGIGPLLFLLFLTLKLTHVIDWSWWAVTAPLWIPVGVGCVLLVCCALVVTICAWLDR